MSQMKTNVVEIKTHANKMKNLVNKLQKLGINASICKKSDFTIINR